MDHTHEVRWFFAGELPGSMRAWLGGPAVDGDPASRTDRYLLLPSDAAGVKWREGRFEVKAAVGPRAPAAFAARATGLRGGWVKWSAGAGGLPRIADTDGDGLDVHKRRWQRGYVLGQRGLVFRRDEDILVFILERRRGGRDKRLAFRLLAEFRRDQGLVVEVFEVL